jgi:hypothetical protein
MTTLTLSVNSDRGDAVLAQLTRDLQRDLRKLGMPAPETKAPAGPGERGDVFTLGQFAIDLVTSGTVVALLECIKAYVERDSTLRIAIKRPDGSDIDVTLHNVNSTEIRDQLDKLTLTK